MIKDALGVDWDSPEMYYDYPHEYDDEDDDPWANLHERDAREDVFELTGGLRDDCD